LRQIIPTLPEAVEQVVLKALAKEPLQRFSNTIEFAHALTQASTDLSYLPTSLLSWPDPLPFQPPPIQQGASTSTPPISQINSITPPVISDSTLPSEASPRSHCSRPGESSDQPLLAKPQHSLPFSKQRKKTSRSLVSLAVLALVALVMGSVFYLART